MNSVMARYREKWSRIIPMILVMLIAIIFVLNFDIASLNSFLQQYETIGLILCLFVYILLGLTLIPAEPVTFLLLAWQGPVVAVLMATLGNTLRGLVEFSIGGNIGDLADFEKKKANLPFRLGKLPIDSPVFMLFVRMLPGFGSKFVSVAGGAYQVPFLTYLWTTVVANLVGATLVVTLGTGLIKLVK